jgi:hypothetical protein
MARFFALDFFKDKILGRGVRRFLTLLCVTLLSALSLRAQSTMMMQSNDAGTTNTAPAAPKAPSASTATNKPPGPPQTAPPPVPDTFNRYGKIWAPSDDVAHPIKLNVQFPGVGEMKIPSQDELNVRDKLEQLATLSDDAIRAQLALWPPYAKMKLADEGQLLIRIQAFKEQRTKIAMDKARDLGLLNTLTPDQKAKFEKQYWDKRLQMDHELSKQFEPILKAREQKLDEDLFRLFSTVGTAVPPPPAPKPPTNPVAQAKPAPLANAPSATSPNVPIAQGKPAPGTTPPVTH